GDRSEHVANADREAFRVRADRTGGDAVVRGQPREAARIVVARHAVGRVQVRALRQRLHVREAQDRGLRITRNVTAALDRLTDDLARAQLDADADTSGVGVDPGRRLGRAVGGRHAGKAEVPAAAQTHFLLGVAGRVVQLLIVDLRDQRATLVDHSQAPAVASLVRIDVGLTRRVEARERQATTEGGAVRRRTGHALRVAEGRAWVPDAVAG